MESSQNVILVGPMGAGKTSIGRQVAGLLGYEFVDSDREIESRTGADIPWIFDVEGEEGFRKREEAVIEELTLRKQIVLATGGGAVVRMANRQAIKSRGLVVYLKTPIKQQLIRTSRDRNRPLLQNDEPRKVLTKLMAERESLYQDVAHFEVSTDSGGVREVAQQIVGLVKSAF